MKKVLIVDDSKVLRMKLKDIFESLSYEVVEAINGLDAVEKYKENMPEIVTMDIEMPELNGIESVKKIKEIDPDVKVIWMSTVVNQQVTHEAKALCKSIYVTKPANKDTIITSLEKLKRSKYR